MAPGTGPRSAAWPTRPASELLPGDLIHLGSLTFVLVTRTTEADGWVQVTLYDPNRPESRAIRPVAHLSYRADQPVPVAQRAVGLPGSALSADQHDGRPDTGHGADREVDLDRVARLVRASGIDCVIDVLDHSNNTAVLLAGPPTAVPDWAHPWRAHAGPAVRDRTGRCTATTRTLAVGPHDAGATRPISVAAVGAVTEEQIATLIVAQTSTPTTPLTAAAIRALGLHPTQDR